jgi:hypothetical protein
LALFDPIDMSRQLENEELCKSLYDMITVLREHNKDTLSEVIRYSYLMSLSQFIKTSKVEDYGECEEAAA